MRARADVVLLVSCVIAGSAAAGAVLAALYGGGTVSDHVAAGVRASPRVNEGELVAATAVEASAVEAERTVDGDVDTWDADQDAELNVRYATLVMAKSLNSSSFPSVGIPIRSIAEDQRTPVVAVAIQKLVSDADSIVVPTQGATRIRTYYPAGEVDADFLLVDGKRSGHAFSWHKNGRVKSEEEWVAGQRCGWFTWFAESGQKTAEGRYAADLKEGQWITWWDNGSRASEGTYAVGFMTGVWRFWEVDGRVDADRSGVYEGGRLSTAK